MNAALAILFVLIGVMLALAWASPWLSQARARRAQIVPAPRLDTRRADQERARRARKLLNRQTRPTYRGRSNKRCPGKPRPNFALKRKRARKRGG